jgi:crotonobetainyl-CoA:carnitine CoA-transferase CaiB-like acyl-CoA transferase
MEGVDPVMRAVPALGQHTDVILEELDVARETIDAWRAAGVI